MFPALQSKTTNKIIVITGVAVAMVVMGGALDFFLPSAYFDAPHLCSKALKCMQELLAFQNAPRVGLTLLPSRYNTFLVVVTMNTTIVKGRATAAAINIAVFQGFTASP